MTQTRLIRHTNADPAVSQEIAGISSALHALLTVVTDDAFIKRFRGHRDEEGLALTMAEALKFLDQTRLERTAADLVRDPIGEALKGAVRQLGERLHELGGLDLMLNVLDDVADRDPRFQARRTSIMDHRWSGIGSWVS